MEKYLKVAEDGTQTEVPVFKVFESEEEFNKHNQSVSSKGKHELLKETGYESVKDIKAMADKVNALESGSSEQTKAILDKLGIESAESIDEIVSKISKFEEVNGELDKIKSEVELNNKKQKLSELGYDGKFVDFVLNKVDGENFEENAQNYLKENPQFSAEVFNKINSNLDLQGGGKVDISKLSDKEYLEYRKEHNLDGSKIKK